MTASHLWQNHRQIRACRKCLVSAAIRCPPSRGLRAANTTAQHCPAAVLRVGIAVGQDVGVTAALQFSTVCFFPLNLTSFPPLLLMLLLMAQAVPRSYSLLLQEADSGCRSLGQRSRWLLRALGCLCDAPGAKEPPQAQPHMIRAPAQGHPQPWKPPHTQTPAANFSSLQGGFCSSDCRLGPKRKRVCGGGECASLSPPGIRGGGGPAPLHANAPILWGALCGSLQPHGMTRAPASHSSSPALPSQTSAKRCQKAENKATPSLPHSPPHSRRKTFSRGSPSRDGLDAEQRGHKATAQSVQPELSHSWWGLCICSGLSPPVLCAFLVSNAAQHAALPASPYMTEDAAGTAPLHPAALQHRPRPHPQQWDERCCGDDPPPLGAADPREAPEATPPSAGAQVRQHGPGRQRWQPGGTVEALKRSDPGAAGAAEGAERVQKLRAPGQHPRAGVPTSPSCSPRVSAPQPAKPMEMRSISCSG